MGDENAKFAGVLMILTMAAALIYVATSAILFIWPYFLFYVLPFVIASLLIGTTLRFFTKPKDEKRSRMQNLNVLYPILIFAIWIIFFSGERTIEVKTQSYQPQWPKVHSTFNKVRKNAFESAFSESIRIKAKVEEVYDRREIGWIFVLALAIGAPLILVYLLREDEVLNERFIDALVQKRVRIELDEAIAEANKVSAVLLYKAQDSDCRLKEAKFKLEQLEKAELLPSFSASVSKTNASGIQKSGILESELFR